MNREVFLADLRRIPEFDCSDIVDKLTRSPGTGESLRLDPIVPAAVFAALFFVIYSKNSIKRELSK